MNSNITNLKPKSYIDQIPITEIHTFTFFGCSTRSNVFTLVSSMSKVSPKRVSETYKYRESYGRKESLNTYEG